MIKYIKKQVKWEKMKKDDKIYKKRQGNKTLFFYVKDDKIL
jgi:hypothetical protein